MQSLPTQASPAGSPRPPLPLFCRRPAEGLPGQRRPGGQRPPHPGRRPRVTLRPGLGRTSPSATSSSTAPFTCEKHHWKSLPPAGQPPPPAPATERARQAGPAPSYHRPSTRPLAHGPHLPWRGRDAPSRARPTEALRALSPGRRRRCRRRSRRRRGGNFFPFQNGAQCPSPRWMTSSPSASSDGQCRGGCRGRTVRRLRLREPSRGWNRVAAAGLERVSWNSPPTGTGGLLELC